MLRTVLVLTLVGIGAIYTLQGPFYALLLYIGIAYFRPEQWVWTDLIGQLNLSYVSGAWLLLLVLITRQRFIINGRIIIILLFVINTCLSTVFSNYFSYSFPFWNEFLKVIIITYLIVILTTDMVRLRLLLLVMGLGLGLEQAKQGWVYLIFPPGSNNINPLPFLGDNNGVAVGMLMLVPIMAYLARTSQHAWTRRGFWFLLIGCLFRALTTYSRGGFLACGALGGFYLLRTRQKLRFLVGMLAIIMIVLFALPDAFWARMRTIQTYEEDTSATGRLHFWQVALQMANANPLGVGHNAYNAAYDAYDFSHGQYGKGRSVHSSFFGVMAEAGYIGFALYAAVIVGAFWSCHRVRKQAARGSIPIELGHGAVALESSLVVFVVGGSFVPSQYIEMLWHFIGITIVLQRLADQYRAAQGQHLHGQLREKGAAHAAAISYSTLLQPSPIPPEVWERTPVAAQQYVRALEARAVPPEATAQPLLERPQQNSRPSAPSPANTSPQASDQWTRPKFRWLRSGSQSRHPGQSGPLLSVDDVNALSSIKPVFGIARSKRSSRRRLGGVAGHIATMYNPNLMHTTPPLPPNVWKRTPVEAQEYIRMLEAREQISLKA